ncbi:MAG: hypothetical protein JSW05_04645 [Candidatus Thorarchaeota archaeon]|nr:MAG: hypothetical protein JSW05_04645 [Candidatus Thorarchaeota archaeon]
MKRIGEPRPLFIGIIMILVALLVPFAYHLDLNPFGWNSFEAVLWRYVLPITSFFILDNAVHLFPYYAFGFFFVIQIVRHYQGKASRLWTLIVGLYAEIHPFLLSLPVLLRLPSTIAPGGEVMYPVLIPIPVLLLLGAALIYLRPPTRA